MKDIHDIIVLSSDARISKEDLEKLAADHKFMDNMPGRCFLEEFLGNDDDEYDDIDCTSCQTVNEPDAKFCKECGLSLKKTENGLAVGYNLDWCDDDSGRTFFSTFVKKVVPVIKGRIEAFAILYSGDEEDDGVSTSRKLPRKLMGFVVDNGIYQGQETAVTFSPRHGRFVESESDGD